MAASFPQRPSQHQLADESVRFFQNCLPRDWISEEPKKDYGVDLRVSLAQDGNVTGQTLSVQLKASADATAGNFVTLGLAVPTLNFLRNLLDVVLLVKYVAAENEAYWLLLKDFEAQPAAGQKTITVSVPRKNRLTQDPWGYIAYHVAAVHHRKLCANAQGDWKGQSDG
jgi:hypothetical protein